MKMTGKTKGLESFDCFSDIFSFRIEKFENKIED